MSKKLSKVGLVSLLLAMCALFGTVFFGCDNISRLSNSWSDDEPHVFTVGQTAEQALAGIEVKYNNPVTKVIEKVDIFGEDKDKVVIILDTRTATEDDGNDKTTYNEVRTCTITYEGQSTSFKYKVQGAGSSSNNPKPSTNDDKKA